MLEAAPRAGLRSDLTIVPAGGLDKLATFIALLGANELELAVLHDESGRPDQRLEDLVREKLINARNVLTFGMFRDEQMPAKKKVGASKSCSPAPSKNTPTDVEDLLPPTTYVKLFNAAYEKELPKPISESDLGPGSRIMSRVGAYLESQNISLRKDGGFNHYRVAAQVPVRGAELDAACLDRFEALFASLNRLFSEG